MGNLYITKVQNYAHTQTPTTIITLKNERDTLPVPMRILKEDAKQNMCDNLTANHFKHIKNWNRRWRGPSGHSDGIKLMAKLRLAFFEWVKEPAKAAVYKAKGRLENSNKVPIISARSKRAEGPSSYLKMASAHMLMLPSIDGACALARKRGSPPKGAQGLARSDAQLTPRYVVHSAVLRAARRAPASTPANTNYSNSVSVLKLIPIILTILKKYNSFIFLGAFVEGQVMNKLDLELYTTLDTSVYSQFIYVINSAASDKFIIDDPKLITELLFSINKSLASLIAMLSGLVLVRATSLHIGTHIE